MNRNCDFVVSYGVVAGGVESPGTGWDRDLGPSLPHSRYTLTPPDPDKWRRHEAAIAAVLPGLRDTVGRAARLVSDGDAARPD